MDLLELLISILPSIYIVYSIYQLDKYQKEPKTLVFLAIFLGSLSVLPAVWGTYVLEKQLALEGALKFGTLTNVWVYSFVCISFAEESCKFLLLALVFYPLADFDEPFDGIVYSVCIGMGFAILENILYLLEGNIHIAILRAFSAVPAHATFGIFMGYFVGKAKFVPFWQRLPLFAGAVGLPIFIHGLYDFLLFQRASKLLAFAAFGVLLVSIYYALRLITLAQEDSGNISSSEGSDEPPTPNGL